jgi:hypothetical protein
LREVLLEGFHGCLVLTRRGGEEAPKDRCECGVRISRPVVVWVGRNREVAEVVQLAGEAPVPGTPGTRTSLSVTPRTRIHVKQQAG